MNGETSTFEFTTTKLRLESEYVRLSVIDVNGNFRSQHFPIDITPLFPPSEVVSIPDANLAAAVRDEIGDQITTHTMLNLTSLNARNSGIRDLTGLEHAHSLVELDIGYDYIDGEGRVNSNTVSDFSPLAGLTELVYLNLSYTAITDISPLSGLTQLNTLDLFYTAISNISPLAGLTQLAYLDLSYTAITDISPLSGLTQLIRLTFSDTTITDVSPLAGLTQLIWLNLYRNTITDVSPLAGLTQLRFLGLEDNAIADVSPLAGLTQLRSLGLGGNAIADVSPLAGLTQLTSLTLWNSHISDVSAFAGLTQLIYLHLSGNTIVDVAPLKGLTQLTVLDLRNNAILDVSPLIELNLTGTQWNSTGLYLERNPLSYASINTHIPAMQAREIEVRSDSRTPTTLVKILGTAQQGTVNTALPLPFVVEVRDDRNRTFAGVPVTFTVTAGGGRLSATTPTTDATGKTQAHLTLGRTADTTTVRATVADISQSVEFTATAILLSSPVTIHDTNLRVKILETLNKPGSGTLTAADMLTLTTLTANNANIRDLTGLQHAPNLKTLSLKNNNISDVAPFAALIQLETLSLDGNNLSNVSQIEALPQLTTLSLGNNRLSDISSLARLSQLETLSLENNSILDVAPLTSLIQLKTLELTGNLLSHPSLHTHIPAIQAAGVTVSVDLRTPTTLVKVSGTHGVADKALPVSVEVQDEQGLGFSGVPVTFTVTTGGGQLSASNIITDRTGRARTTVTLGSTPGKNVVRAAVVEVSRAVSFTITAVDASSPVTIRDANLRAKIVETLDKSSGVQLTAGDMLALTRLEAPNINIKDLTGLEHAHNLTTLNLGGEYISGEGTMNSNTISNFSPLNRLPQLTVLNLSFSSLTDVSFLSRLTQLSNLQLWNNSISDVSFLAGLTQLTSLNLDNNTVSDVSFLVGLTQLKNLSLRSNPISDISVLAGLTQLESLYLNGPDISNISALSELTQLTLLGIWGASVSDISALSGLTQLRTLYLDNNAIANVKPLAELTQLKTLRLSGNAIADVSALSGLTQVGQLILSRNMISDVSPLMELPQLVGPESWRGLYLERNPLSYASIHTHIPTMRAKGIKVTFNNVPHPALLKISGDAQEDASGTALATPFVVEAVDARGKPMQGVPVTFAITAGSGRLSATTSTTDATGKARTTLTLGRNPGKQTVTATAKEITPSVLTFTAIAMGGPVRIAEDVNGDGVVNIQDLVLVSSSFGQTGENSADVNGDGTVNISDLVLVAGAFGEGAAAAPALHLSHLAGLTAAEVQDLLTQARQMALTDPAYLRGIAVLEQLLALLLPKETALLPNYPNPFNPETWIPYQLSKPSEVTLHIYAVNGSLVRTLVLGYQAVGMYHSKSRAAYWDGRNEVGESVASGVYFYTLTAGDFIATRKMLIRK